MSVLVRRDFYSLKFGAVAAANEAVSFDGTNDWLTRGAALSGQADSKVGIVSFWVKVLSANDVNRYFLEGVGSCFIVRDSSNKLIIRDENNVAINLASSVNLTSVDGWVHILASWDNVAAGAKLYLDDVDRTNVVNQVNVNVPYASSTDWNVGAAAPGGTLKINADIYDFYFNIATFLDLTVTANRRKFIDGSGNPVSLGADGSTPTGTAPIIFLSGPASSWHTNKGTGGGFTLNGALTSATNPP